MTERMPSVDGGLLAAGLFVAAAGAVFLALGWMATPAGFGQRARQADEEITRAEATMAKAPREARFSSSAICADSADKAAGDLRARVETAAAATGVTLANVASAPAEGQVGSGIAPVTLKFEATGRYDAVVSMLSALSRSTPEIFTDSADLTSQVSSVDFKFTGEVYCSARV